MSRSHRASRFTPLLAGSAVVLAVLGLAAPSASAAAGTATATMSPSSPGAGTTSAYAFTLAPTSGQISSFNLSIPSGWTITSHGDPAGIDWSSSTTIKGRGLSITASSPYTLNFDAQAPCAATATTWTVVAKTGGNFTGTQYSIASQPSTPLSSQCHAAFVAGREPADAALNGGSTSENITSVAYAPDTTTNPGNAIQVHVTDASGADRDGIAITLALTSAPAGGALSGSLTATSQDGGLATFPGSPNSITIGTVGQGYKMTPTNSALNVDGTEQPDAFGIYQQGKACTTTPCSASGVGGNTLTATVSAPAGGDLGVFVSTSVAVTCDGYTSPFSSSPSIVWKYTGDGTQTIVADLSKKMMREVLDRGSSHLEFCFDSEGKPFTDKFGVAHWGTSGNDTNGLLADCNTGIDTTNCIVSEIALSGGGRRVVVTVADGKGRI